MFPVVESVEHLGGTRVRLRFDDGAEGEVDIRQAVKFEGVFAELNDPEFFVTVRVDPGSGTIVWPNGADLDPLVLHSRVTGETIKLDGPTRRAG